MNSTPTIQLAPTELPSVTPIGNLLSNLDEATRARVLEERFMKCPLVIATDPLAKKIQEYLIKCALFDAEQGLFIRTKSMPGRTKPGVMGNIDHGYVSIRIANVKYYQSHLIHLWFTGRLLRTTEEMDHLDGNSSNDRPNNLRLVLPKINQRNKKMLCSNSSGYTGVSFHISNKYRARVFDKHLGLFNTAYEAHLVRQAYIAAHPELGFTMRHGT